jgi:hypothetical protein
MQDDAMDFVVAFLAYYDQEGIEDKFDNKRNKMVTSPGIESLVKQARELAPDKLGPLQAANAMRDLDEAKRDAAVEGSSKVIDMRAAFGRKIQENGGTRAMLLKLAEAMENGDPIDPEFLSMVQQYRRAENGEDVSSNPTPE